jgi:hypothetical protein
MKRILISLILGISPLLLSTCGSNSNIAPDDDDDTTYFSCEIVPDDPVISIGQKIQLKIKKIDPDGTEYIMKISTIWSTSASHVAVVTREGVVTGIGPGRAGISCIYQEREITTTVLVVDARIMPSEAVIKYGESLQFGVTGIPSDISDINISWDASPGEIAQIDDSGVATGTGVGVATITASFGFVKLQTSLLVAGIVSIRIEPSSSVVIKINQSVSFSCYAEYNNGLTEQVFATWSSSDTSVATIDSTGQATGINAGRCTITATYTTEYSTFTAQTTLGVVELSGIQIIPQSAIMKKGDEGTFFCDGVYSNSFGDTLSEPINATWSLSDTNIATIKSPDAGVLSSSCTLKAENYGTVDLIATSNGFTSTASIEIIDLIIDPPVASAIINETKTIKFKVTFIDSSGNSTTVSPGTWLLSDTNHRRSDRERK